MTPWGGHWGVGAGALWPIAWLVLVLAVLAVVLLLAFRYLERPERPAESTPLSILERRYARGEIDDEEFRQRRERLAERPPS